MFCTLDLVGATKIRCKGALGFGSVSKIERSGFWAPIQQLLVGEENIAKKKSHAVVHHQVGLQDFFQCTFARKF